MHSYQTYTGTNYVVTWALLVCGFVVSPALLLLSGPISSGAVAVAFGSSALFLALAKISWRRFSNLTISSVVR